MATTDSTTVYREYRDRIQRHILSLVRDPTEAEDLTQETFLRAHEKLASLRDPATLPVWLYRIATNLCYDRYRSRQTAETVDVATPDGEAEASASVGLGPRLDVVVEQAEMSDCVREFIDELPDDYRTALLLHDLQGLTNPEIAQMLECTVATVKIRVHRARRRLAAALEAGCDFSYDERGVRVCDRRDPGD